MFCMSCGKELPSKAKFCPYCGNGNVSSVNTPELTKNNDHILSSRPMTFTEAIASGFSKYSVFKGRASRSEYWWFYLFTILITWAYDIVLALTVADETLRVIPVLICSFVILIPQLSAATRRLHDTGRSGWNQLWALTIIGMIPLIIWLASEGDKKNNQYGEVNLTPNN